METHLRELHVEPKPDTEARGVLPSDVLKVIIGEEEQQEDSEPPPHIKEEQEEQEELWSSQTTKFPFTPVPVKSEDEEKPQSSQLHHRQSQQMETGADGEDSAGPGLHSDPHPETCIEADRLKSVDGIRTRVRKIVKKSHGCSVCGKLFKTKWLLAQHARIHTGEKPFSCSTCGKRFTVKSSLINHVKTHPPDKDQTGSDINNKRPRAEKRSESCSSCGRTFERKHNLIRHMRTHTGEKPFTCSICGKRFTQKANLNAHMMLHSGGDTELTETLTEHSGEQPEERPFSCSQCGKTYTRKCHLSLHMRIHSEEKPFGCPECGKRFYRKFCLTLHMAHHRGEKPYGCSACEQRFSWQTQLKRHVCVSPHSGSHQSQTQEERGSDTEADREDCGGPGPSEKSIQTKSSSDFKTEDCEDPSGLDSGGRTEEFGAALQQLVVMKEEPPEQQEDSEPPPYIKEEQEEQEELWSSQEGGEQLQGLEEAETTKFPFTPVPVKSEGEEEKPQSSQLLDRGGSKEAGGNQGVKLKAVKKLHGCSECGKTFKTNQHLVRHFRIHTGEKPFSCSLCGRRFNLRENLSKHDVIHKGGKTFSCSTCGKSFIRKGDLTRHMKIHSGVKPFSCSECGTCFNFKQNLTRHMRIHIRQRASSCSQSSPRFHQTEDFGGPEPEIEVQLEDSSGAETEDSGDWRESRERQSDSETLVLVI